MVRRTWRGDELDVRAKRATGRAIVGMGESAAAKMAELAHVESGDLRRSVHAAKVETMGAVDPDEQNVNVRDFYQIEVGSWLPYACVEEDRGGDHRFATIGWELSRPFFDDQLKRAWAEEGLR
jgi:hypothetical protein